ncbi:MAG: hypothetical protein DLM50_04395 [Candidatus Meridianibacter frigidus]|nr:MAG: hypothetical protein DLM50_04395 [Candidatus Eremiobacteraeota bacterium]
MVRTLSYAEQLDECGYVILPSILSPDTIARTTQRIEQLLDASLSTAEYLHGSKGTAHLKDLDPELPWIAHALREEPIARLVRQHLGDASHRGITYRAPMPGHGAQTLHVDWIGPVYEKHVVCTVLLALVDISGRNGGTRLVRGSHRDVPRMLPKSLRDRMPGEIIPALTAGDALLFSGHIYHGGSENNSPHPRHALLINYEGIR